MLFSRFKNQKLIGLGEVLFDVFQEKEKLGGAPANFVFHSKQMGLPARVVSAVGQDDLGQKALTILENYKIESTLQEMPFPTGAVRISLDDAGIATYQFLENAAFDHLSYTVELEQIAQNTGIVCFGTLAQRNEISRKTILQFLNEMPKDSCRIFDVNLRGNFYSTEIILESLKHCNVLKLNEAEFAILSNLFSSKDKEKFHQCMKERHDISCVILTEGAMQSTIFLNDEISQLQTLKVPVVDTVGAGDAFLATFIALMVDGRTLNEAHKAANERAAFVCTREGAMPMK